jgi:transcriptional regulator with XRE-family HTH domain
MGWSVARKNSSPTKETSFGERLASLRQANGLSQRQLEKLSGVSHRMIAYYEGRDALPPGHVLSALAEALATSVDELVGKKTHSNGAARSVTSRRLMRRLQQMEKLPLRDKRELLSIIDTYLERHKLAQRAAT